MGLQAENLNTAFELYQEMEDTGLEADCVTYATLMDVCAEARQGQRAVTLMQVCLFVCVTSTTLADFRRCNWDLCGPTCQVSCAVSNNARTFGKAETQQPVWIGCWRSTASAHKCHQRTVGGLLQASFVISQQDGFTWMSGGLSTSTQSF